MHSQTLVLATGVADYSDSYVDAYLVNLDYAIRIIIDLSADNFISFSSCQFIETPKVPPLYESKSVNIQFLVTAARTRLCTLQSGQLQHGSDLLLHQFLSVVLFIIIFLEEFYNH